MNLRYSFRYGELAVPDVDDLIVTAVRLYGEWAQLEIDLLLRVIDKGQTVVDAGAFLGTHSRAFSEMVGPEGMVHAFEANPAIWPLLQENAALAANSNIAVHCVGLGASRSHHTIAGAQQQRNLGTARIGPAAAVGTARSFAVDRLDNLLSGPLDFVKIDVEGMEVEVLEGAQRLIDSSRPLVFAELNTIGQGCELLAWAKRNRYEAWGALADAYNPQNFRGESTNVFGNAREAGLLMAARDRCQEREHAIGDLGLPLVCSADDLAMLLLNKPQYVVDVLGHTQAARLLGSPPTATLVETAALAQAMTRAEELALERLSELQRLSESYALMEAAKERAEELALDRAREIEALEGENNTLRTDLTGSQADLDALRTERDRLQAELAEALDEVAWLRSWRRYFGRRPPRP